MTSIMKNFLMSTLLFSFATYAEPIVPVPDQIVGIQRVDAERVIALAEKFKRLVIVDSRIPADRMIGYIEHSISLPDAKTNCTSLAKIIPSKSTPVIFYCNGVKCGRSVVATKAASECGFKQIYWFRGGFEEWKAKGYPFLHE